MDQLAAAVLRAQPMADYQQAKARLDADPEARELLDRLAKAQSDLRVRQAQNAVTQADVDQLRAIQRQVQSNRKNHGLRQNSAGGGCIPAHGEPGDQSVAWRRFRCAGWPRKLLRC